MQEDAAPADTEPDSVTVKQMPLGTVVARIIVVSGMSFAAAFAIFFLVGGLWLLGLLSLAATAVFLLLMFAIERGAESRTGAPHHPDLDNR